MKILIEKKNLSSRLMCFLVSNYYLFAMAMYLYVLKKSEFRVGVYSGIVMLVIAVLYILKYGIRSKLYGTEIYVFMYLIISLASCINYLPEKVSIVVFFQTVVNSLFPLVFFACGSNGIFFSKKSFLIGFDICCIFGIYLLFTKPSWYFLFCIERGYSFTRLSACFGSTAVGTLSCVAIVYSLELIKNSKSVIYKIQYLMSCVFCLLSMQRSAWIAGLLSIIVLHYWLLKVGSINTYHILIEIVCIISVCFFAREYVIGVFERWVLEHNVSGSKIYEIFSRSTQWKAALKESDWIIGSGLGLRGHRSISVGVADGDWIRILCEIGILGVILLLFIVCRSMVISKYDKERCIGPLLIIICYALQAIGSNVFEYQILAPAFWMSVGEISFAYSTKFIEMEKIRNENNCTISTSISQDTRE